MFEAHMNTQPPTDQSPRGVLWTFLIWMARQRGNADIKLEYPPLRFSNALSLV